MSRFEYLSVLVSIVIALGISEIASSWGRLLRSRARVRFYWLHAFWSLFTILLMVQFWWGFWQFRDVESWTFAGLLAVVAESLVLVLAAMALLPGTDGNARIDLRTFYFDQARLYFSLGGIFLALLALVDWSVGEQPFLDRENVFRLPGLIVAALGAVRPDEKLHTAIALLASVLLIGFVADPAGP